MEKQTIYNEECKTMADQWKDAKINNPHSFIIQHEDMRAVFEPYIENLAKSFHEKQGLTLPLNRCFLSLEYSKDMSDYSRLRFFDSPRQVAKFRNEFEGVFSIKISGWEDKLDHRDFQKLMEYVRQNGRNENVRYIFTVVTKDKNFAHQLYNRIARNVRLQKITMTYLNEDMRLDYMISEINAKGFEVPQEMRSRLEECVKTLTAEKIGFYGEDMASRFVEDLLFQAQLHGKDLNITDEHLDLMEKEYQYIAKTPDIKIGF